MSDDRIAALEAKIGELQAEITKLKEPEEEKPFVPMKMPRFDPTEGMSMPPSAVKAMCDVWPTPRKEFDPSAWARNSVGQPGGFGPPPGGKWDKGAAKPREGRDELKVEPPPWSGWSK